MEAVKERIRHYWTERAEAFTELRLRELASEKAGRWLTEIYKYLPPADQNPRILDAGCGTGFFTLLLSREGYSVTGIDLTEEMILDAEKSARLLELPAEFYVMDAECPGFTPGSFDIILTRNLTWTLPHLPQTYNAWYQILSDNGVLINFDADYCYCLKKEDKPELPPEHAHNKISAELMKENDAITLAISEYQSRRPEWDVRLLLNAGFREIIVDNGVWSRIYAEKDEFYNPAPIFTIVAYKAEREPQAQIQIRSRQHESNDIWKTNQNANV